MPVRRSAVYPLPIENGYSAPKRTELESWKWRGQLIVGTAIERWKPGNPFMRGVFGVGAEGDRRLEDADERLEPCADPQLWDRLPGEPPTDDGERRSVEAPERITRRGGLPFDRVRIIRQGDVRREHAAGGGPPLLF